MVAVPGWAIPTTIILTALVAIVLTIAAPRIYRRIRYRGAYSELNNDLMAPVPT